MDVLVHGLRLIGRLRALACLGRRMGEAPIEEKDEKGHSRTAHGGFRIP